MTAQKSKPGSQDRYERRDIRYRTGIVHARKKPRGPMFCFGLSTVRLMNEYGIVGVENLRLLYLGNAKRKYRSGLGIWHSAWSHRTAGSEELHNLSFVLC